MKTLITSLFLILISPSFAQQLVQTDEQLLHSLIEKSFDVIFSEYQTARMSEFYTPDFLLLEQGEIWDWAIIEAKLSQGKNKPKIRTNQFEFIKTEIEGNRAWIAYHNWAIFAKEGEPVREIYWLESATAVKTPQGWKLDMLHSTRGQREK
jgi:hypothetical protein